MTTDLHIAQILMHTFHQAKVSVVFPDETVMLESESAMSRIVVWFSFDLLREESTSTTDVVNRAFYALFFNRTTFSGILDSGPIGGEKQRRDNFTPEKGELHVGVRWNAKNLTNNLVEARKTLLGRTFVFDKDFSTFITEHVPSGAFMYLDPPYFKAGDALYGEEYRFGTDRHERLQQLLVARRRENWLLSYDNDPRARAAYSDFSVQAIEHFRSMNSNIVDAKGKSELLIQSDIADPKACIGGPGFACMEATA